MVVLSAVDDHRQEVLWEHLTLREGGVPFSIDELESAIKSLKAGKALGPDGVENLGVKAAYHTDPSGLLNVYNSCKAEGVFPSRWKVVQLILLRKESKPLDWPSSYTPVCLIDCLGKVLEKLIIERLNKYIKDFQCHSGSQYGFRRAGPWWML